MNLIVDGKTRNCIFVVMLGVTLISLLMVRAVGEQQDKAYRENYNRYQLALKLAGEQKYSDAAQIIEQLDDDSKTTYQVLYLQALCLEKNGDYTAAAESMQKARDTRPALLQDQTFLYKFGTIYYAMGDYDRSRIYLQESLKYPDDQGTVQEAGKYLAEINKISASGR